MEAGQGPQTPFETYCYQCRVTFPINQRRCIHCGGRLGARRFEAGRELPPSLDEVEAELEEGTGRRGVMSPITLIWIVLALFGAMYRACSNGG